MLPTFAHLIREADLAHQPGSEKTQRPNTGPSYVKAAKLLAPRLPKGAKVLDFGAGLGKGTLAMQQELPQAKVEAFEPWSRDPAASIDYTKSSQLKPGYDAIVCLNVVNVMEPELRANAIKLMLDLIKPSGFLIIGARRWSGAVNSALKGGRLGDEPHSLWTSGNVYQKGFDGRELQTFVQTVVGPKDYVGGLSHICDVAVVVQKAPTNTQTFAVPLKEVADRPLAWSWDDRPTWGGSKSRSASFRLPDGTRYSVDFEYKDDIDTGSCWDLSFQNESASDWAKSAGVIGNTKSEFLVFATVVDVVKNFVADEEPAEIGFSAHEPSRKKLYTTFMKRLSTSIPGYHGVAANPQDRNGISEPGWYEIVKD